MRPCRSGTTNQTVEVTGAGDVVAPVDSGTKSSQLTTKELQNYVQVGSNAAEYIKIMPGFGIQNGAQNKANYNGQTIGINANGDSGSQSPLNNAFSYNGLPSNTLDIVADGAHVSDPGCNCDTPVNPNSDFVQEFRVLASNFSAEEQKGPMVITSVTKSGGTSFPRKRILFGAERCIEFQRRVCQCHRPDAAGKQVLLSGRNDRRSGNSSLDTLQPETRQAVLLHRIRILLSGSRHKIIDRNSADTGHDQRELLAGGTCEVRRHNCIGQGARRCAG